MTIQRPHYTHFSLLCILFRKVDCRKYFKFMYKFVTIDGHKWIMLQMDFSWLRYRALLFNLIWLMNIEHYVAMRYKKLSFIIHFIQWLNIHFRLFFGLLHFVTQCGKYSVFGLLSATVFTFIETRAFRDKLPNIQSLENAKQELLG